MVHMVGFLGMCLCLTFVFLVSGLVINLLQVVLYLLLFNRNRRLYRKINYYFMYTSWSQILAMVEWWSGSSCNLYGDEESLRQFGKEHTMVVMNHKYDTDWLMCWFVCDKLGILGSAKSVAKKSLRNLPVIGWGWIFAELIFLERNWEKDKLVLGPKLDNLMEYDDPILLLFFCEGTRFTEEKHKASLEFARSRNLPLLKHHLCPRTNGFNFCVQHLKGKMTAIYDCQLAFPNTPLKPTFSNLLRGHSFVGDMHIRRIPLEDIPTESDEATTRWLHQLYQEKDKVMDDYMRTNKFPGKCIPMKRSVKSLLNSLFWHIIVGVPFLYLIFKLLFMGSPWVTAATLTVLALLFSATYMMVRVTKADKGSSYGKDKKSPATTPLNSLPANQETNDHPFDKETAGHSASEETNGRCQSSVPPEERNRNALPKVRVTMHHDTNDNEELL